MTYTNIKEETELNESDVIQSAQIAAAKFPALGLALWLLARTPEYADRPLKMIDQHLLPPLILDQFRIFMQGNLPIAFATWASLSDEVLARFKIDRNSLKVHEWHSGSTKVLVDFVCPFGGYQAILEELKNDPKLSGLEMLS